MEGVSIHHSLVKYETVGFVSWDDVQFFGGGISSEEMWVQYINGTSVVLRVSEFVKNVLSQDVVV